MSEVDLKIVAIDPSDTNQQAHITGVMKHLNNYLNRNLMLHGSIGDLRDTRYLGIAREFTGTRTFDVLAILVVPEESSEIVFGPRFQMVHQSFSDLPNPMLVVLVPTYLFRLKMRLGNILPHNFNLLLILIYCQ